MIESTSPTTALPNSWNERLAQLQTTFLETVQNHMQALTQTMGETLSTWQEDLQVVQHGLSRLQTLDQERQSILNDMMMRLTRLQTLLPTTDPAPDSSQTAMSPIVQTTDSPLNTPKPPHETAAPNSAPVYAYDTIHPDSTVRPVELGHDHPHATYGPPMPEATSPSSSTTAKVSEPDTVLPKLIQSF